MLPDRNAGLADFIKDQIERVLRALEHRGERDVERQTLRLQLAAGFFCLRDPLPCEIWILPAGKKIFQVPFALAMTHQHKKTVAHFLDSVQISRSRPLFECDRFGKPVPTFPAHALARTRQGRARRPSNRARASCRGPTAPLSARLARTCS